MRSIIYTCVIIILIISLSSLTINILFNNTQALVELLIKIEKEIIRGRWEEAVIMQRQLSDKWDKYKKIWPMIIDHMEIDTISSNIAELQVFINCKNKVLALSKLSVLKELVEQIPEREYVTIQNIL